jgi:predicted short-subunit dehydrogenase-like oxidoreductase (DUF2520 family)
MKKRVIPSISIIGAGNVASHLAPAFSKAGVGVRQIWSRTSAHGSPLARRVHAAFIKDLDELDTRVDMIMISVPDGVLPDIMKNIPRSNALVVHTSGSLPLSILSPLSNRTGVFYPLQTFRRGVRLNMSDVPLCIEASLEEDRFMLLSLAQNISRNVVFMDSEDRRILHLAAIFACNFSNYMYVIAEEILKRRDIPLNLLQPLIRRTALNARKKDIFKYQTGPAFREDRLTMAGHVQLLKSNPEYRTLYEQISQLIIQQKKKNGKL